SDLWQISGLSVYFSCPCTRGRIGWGLIHRCNWLIAKECYYAKPSFHLSSFSLRFPPTVAILARIRAAGRAPVVESSYTLGRADRPSVRRHFLHHQRCHYGGQKRRYH